MGLQYLRNTFRCILDEHYAATEKNKVSWFKRSDQKFFALSTLSILTTCSTAIKLEFVYQNKIKARDGCANA